MEKIQTEVSVCIEDLEDALKSIEGVAKLTRLYEYLKAVDKLIDDSEYLL